MTGFVFDTERFDALAGKTIVVTGKLKKFAGRNEFSECLTAADAVLSETLTDQTDYLLTNTLDSGTAKNKKAEQMGVKKTTEDKFSQLIGRHCSISLQHG